MNYSVNGNLRALNEIAKNLARVGDNDISDELFEIYRDLTEFYNDVKSFTKYLQNDVGKIISNF